MIHAHRIPPGYVFLGVVEGNLPEEVYANFELKRWCFADSAYNNSKILYRDWKNPGDYFLSQKFLSNVLPVLKKFFEGDISISPNSR